MIDKKTNFSDEHQAPSGVYDNIDYSEKMPSLNFEYDKDFYPLDEDLPDPQVRPIIPGARIPLDKVGIGPVDLPIKVFREDGSTQTLQAEASLYCSLDDRNAKGLNLSRLYLLMHDTIKDHVTIDGISSALEVMANKQGASKAYCKLRFKYPMTQKALRTRMPLTDDELTEGKFQLLSNGEKISLRKMEGHVAYKVTLEGRYDRDNKTNPLSFFLTTEYIYSSTCPCSFELAYTATEKRNAAANAHSQRSILTSTVQFYPTETITIEDMIYLHRQHIPTETQVVVKRRDEMAQTELNGANMLFSEDSVRIMAAAFNDWYDGNRIIDYTISACHYESLHSWNAIAIVSKHNDIAPV